MVLAGTTQSTGIMIWNTVAALASGMVAVKAMATDLTAKKNVKMCVYNHHPKVSL